VRLIRILFSDITHPGDIPRRLPPRENSPGGIRLRKSQVPRTRSKLGERAFCVSGPLVRNSLPESLRTVDCITTFRRRLKTHFSFLTSTYRDFIFTLLVFSIVDICTARPTRVVVGLALNTVMLCNVM